MYVFSKIISAAEMINTQLSLFNKLYRKYMSDRAAGKFSADQQFLKYTQLFNAFDKKTDVQAQFWYEIYLHHTVLDQDPYIKYTVVRMLGFNRTRTALLVLKQIYRDRGHTKLQRAVLGSIAWLGTSKVPGVSAEAKRFLKQEFKKEKDLGLQVLMELNDSSDAHTWLVTLLFPQKRSRG